MFEFTRFIGPARYLCPFQHVEETNRNCFLLQRRGAILRMHKAVQESVPSGMRLARRTTGYPQFKYEHHVRNITLSIKAEN